MKLYTDSDLTPAARARDLLGQLSLDEKIAQVTGCFVMPGKEEDLLPAIRNGIGSFSTLFFRSVTTEDEAVRIQIRFQKMVIAASPHHIPAIFHMEGLCGSYVHGSTPFPSGINRGCTFDPALEEEIGRIVSRQESAYGITQILAPVLDISRDPRMGRVSETYGEDPTLAAAMGTAFTRGIQETETDGRHPESTAKHFLGFHHSQGGIHGANADMGERLLEEIYGKPFQAAIQEAGLHGIMPCYDSLNGLPMHVSKKYLNGLLRERMGFEGMVSSDYSGISNAYSVQHIGESIADVGERALMAGVDLELPQPAAYSEELKQRFQSGEADIAILDRAVLHVLEAKFRMGLFEHPFAIEDDGERLAAAHRPEDEEVSRRAAQESIVLLKNDGILPLIRTNADNLPSMQYPAQADKRNTRTIPDQQKGTDRQNGTDPQNDTGRQSGADPQNSAGRQRNFDHTTIAVIGPHAANARYYFGGYTHLSMAEADRAAMRSMAGVGAGGDISRVEMKRVPGTNVQDDDSPEFDSILSWLYPDCRTLLDVLKEQLPSAEILYAKGYPKAGADESGFARALRLVQKADLVILTLGGKNGSGSIATMGEGVDGTDINLPACQDAFIRQAAAFGKPMIGIHFDGRPISSDTADQYLSAIIEAWTPAKYAAEAIVNVLTGKYNPSGRLALTVARNAGQIPVYYNHPNGSAWHQGESIGFADYVDLPHTPRYYFGYGLSYTHFSYRNLSVDNKEVAPFGEVHISCHVRNDGPVAGTEIVQLYLSDPHARMTRPVQELQGFARIFLQPSEEKTITFTVHPSQMAFLDEDMNWLIEKGEIQVRIGASSQDIRLEDSFYVTSSACIEGKDRALLSQPE